MHVTLNHQHGEPGKLIEVYAKVGKAGCLENGLFEAIGRLASAFLQYAAKFGEVERQKAQDEIINQLNGIESGYTTWHTFPGHAKPKVIRSACDGLAHAIRFYDGLFAAKAKAPENVLGIPDKYEPVIPIILIRDTEKYEPVIPIISVPKTSVRGCGRCGGEVILMEGCKVCSDCGYSSCG